jgi:deoxyribose-phosphate aldolase
VVCAPEGKPTRIKLLEADQLIADGVQEMDMMLNVGKFRSGEYDYVEDEIRQIVLAAGEKNVLVKVILEVYFLTPDEIRKACELCIKAGAEYIKTSTGWAPHGATPEVISLITSFVGSAIKVKAAGSIRDLATLVDMYRMGVSRFGINVNASMDIIKELTALPNSRIEV